MDQNKENSNIHIPPPSLWGINSDLIIDPRIFRDSNTVHPPDIDSTAPHISSKVLGVKEKNNKLSYAEINPAYIASMARRMGDNKGKYPCNNWKHDIDKNEILDALERHLCDLKLLLNGEEPIHSMVETPVDHLAALGCNSMILNYLVTRKI
jgi:hypothetical protein